MGSSVPNPYATAPTLCMRRFVVYLVCPGVNPLCAHFSTLPQPVKSMPVHVTSTVYME